MGHGSRSGAGRDVDCGRRLDKRHLVLAVTEIPEAAYTAFVHLVADDGEVVAQGDGLLMNSLSRSSEEWEPDEVIAAPLPIDIPSLSRRVPTECG